MIRSNGEEQFVIRDGWSDEERENRRELAGVMQLQLRSLVVLSSLSKVKEETDERQMAMASAC